MPPIYFGCNARDVSQPRVRFDKVRSGTEGVTEPRGALVYLLNLGVGARGRRGFPVSHGHDDARGKSVRDNSITPP